MNTPENVERVAVAFLNVMRRWFKTKHKPVDILNANDHFDANMAMDEAFTACGLKALPDEGQMTQEACDLWNAAWDRTAILNGEQPS